MNAGILFAALLAQASPEVDSDGILGQGRLVPDVSVNLTADVASICSAFREGASPSEDDTFLVNLGTLSDVAMDVETGSIVPIAIRYVCNDPDGFTRVLVSQNGGYLVRVGTAGGTGDAIPYFVEGAGEPGLDPPLTQLSSPSSASVAGSARLLSGVSTSLRVRVQGVRRPADGGGETTTSFAGDYVDTLTLTLTAN
jgi:hypothetical protein